MKSTTMPPLKERLIKTVLSHLDGEMRVINLQQMTEEILSLLKPSINWAEIDPAKWGDVETSGWYTDPETGWNCIDGTISQREQGDLPLDEGHG